MITTSMTVIITIVIAATTTTISVLVGASIHREITRLQRRHLRRREREVTLREYRQELFHQGLDDAPGRTDRSGV